MHIDLWLLLRGIALRATLISINEGSPVGT